MRMAEVKAAPPLSAASENPPSNEVTQNSKPKSSGGGGGSGRRRGGDRGGGNGSSHGGGTGSGHGQTGNSYDNDRADSVGRSSSRKKPELEHYKPGAFHGSRTPNNELNDQTPQQDETPQHSSGNKHSKGGGNRSKRGGHHQQQQQQQSSNHEVSLEQVSDKVGSISIESSTSNSAVNSTTKDNNTDKTSAAGNTGSGNSQNRRNHHRKKPDQAHYVPKNKLISGNAANYDSAESVSAKETSTATAPNAVSGSSKDIIKETNLDQSDKSSRSDQNQGRNTNRKNKGKSGGNGGNKRKDQQQNQQPSSLPDQNTKSNVGKEVKHVEESQRNGHHLSDEQHQQQQRPNKQTNNQNRRDRDRGGDPRGGNGSGSHVTAQNSSNTVHTGNSSRGGSENHEIHENNLPPRLRGQQQKDQQGQHADHNNGGHQRSADRGGRNKGGNKRGQPTHQAQNNRNQSPTKGNGSGGNNAPNNDDRSSDRGKNRYQHYDQQRNLERESSSPMVTAATGSETATGRSPSPNSISGQNQLISGSGSQQHPQHHQQQQQRRDSASSRHNNRRSYSPTSRTGGTGSPTQNQNNRGAPRGGGSDLRGQGSQQYRRGGGDRGGPRGGGRFDYHRDSRDSSDWRFGEHQQDHGHRGGVSDPRGGGEHTRGGGGDRGGSQKIIPPRFQRSRGGGSDWKDHEYRSGNQDNYNSSRRGRNVQSNIRDYEVDDTRVYDYEKDDDEEDEKPQPRISDWGLEVEEEEERLSHVVPVKSAPTGSAASTAEQPQGHRGGIIRLPPDAMTSTTYDSMTASGSHSGDWRAHPPPPHHPQQPHQQPPQYQRQHSSNSGGDHFNYNNHYNEPQINPAWRGMSEHTPGYRQPLTAPSSDRYLYDPRNPQKPIPAQRGARFPMDPRFAPPPTLAAAAAPPGPSGGSGSGGHPGGPPGYRPPFPPTTASSSSSSMMPGSATAEGEEAAKILGANELRLKAIVTSGGPQKLCQLWHTDVYEVRQNIMRTFRHLLGSDLVFCAKSDVEFFVWKICFYNLVATLRHWLQGGAIPQAQRQEVEENVIELLDEGLEFYTEMLETLDKTYHIGLEQYYDVLEIRSSDTKIRCALVSAQKCLLCLGDLARYKEMIQNTSNYGKARQYYQKASHIDTRNAKPFNQLAILAWTAKRKFEAVYYHMRCLQTKTPVETSRQSLVEIFEDIRKRWDVSEKKRLEDRAQRKKDADSERDRMHLIKGTRLRKEIWIRPDGGRRLHRTTSAQEGAPDSEEAELKAMSTTDLNRRFNNAFLHLIGTLYTHINIDAFSIGCDLLQKEFRILLSRSPLPIDCKRLVQIMALNMFIIEHTKMKPDNTNNSSAASVSSQKNAKDGSTNANQHQYVSVTQNYALQLAFELFGILVERCNDLMLSFIPATTLGGSDLAAGNSQSIFHDDDLPNLLSAVKVWCDWLMGNNDTWYPVLCDEPFNELAKLATHLEKLKPIISPILLQCLNEEKYDQLALNKKGEYEMIKLDEDAVLCGFTPWTLGVNWPIYRRFAPRNVPTTLLQDARRLDAINFCIDFLEGLEPPVLKWSPPDNAHISLIETMGHSTADRVNAKLTHMLSREQDILEETYSDDESKTTGTKLELVPSGGDFDPNSKIGQLKMRKEELERRRQEEEDSRKLQQQILSEHVSVTLEVCPKYVVPDTNCFVDFLPEISRLANQSPFQLRVPVVVLKELDGLAKGARPAKYASPDHAAMVAENARHALSFLKERNPNIKCVTSRGTVMPSLGIASEDDYDADKNNDDLILDACQNLAGFREELKLNMRVVYRDLVLLTDDRNLKLKAHMTDIPVNKLSDFIHWAYSNTA